MGTIVPVSLLLWALLGLWLRSLLDQELLCQKDFTHKLLCKQTRWEPGIYGRAGEGLVEIPQLPVSARPVTAAQTKGTCLLV